MPHSINKHLSFLFFLVMAGWLLATFTDWEAPTPENFRKLNAKIEAGEIEGMR